MIHMSDLSWDDAGETGDGRLRQGPGRSRRKVLDVDVEKERISLGIKQLQ